MTAPGQGRVGAIVVTFNSARTIQQCLLSLVASEVIDQIVVVDNASSDDTVIKARACSPEILVLENIANLGFGRAANRGASALETRVVAFVNPDAVAGTQTIEILADRLESTQTNLATGPALINDGGEREFSARSFPTVWNMYFNRRFHDLFPESRHPELVRFLKLGEDREKTFACDWLSGAFFLMRKTDFDALGGFDESYFLYSEDVDLFKRSSRDRTVLFIGEALATHQIGGSSRSVSVQAGWWRVKALVIYYRRHLRRGLRSDFKFALLLAAGIACELVARAVDLSRSAASR